MEQKNILIRHAYLWHAATVLTKLSFVYHAKIACLCHHHYAGNPVEGYIPYTPKTVGASSEYPATVFKHSKLTFFCHSARCSLARYNKKSWGGHLFEEFKVLCWHHVCISFCFTPVFTIIWRQVHKVESIWIQGLTCVLFIDNILRTQAILQICIYISYWYES